MLTLSTPITALSRVGKQVAAQCRHLGIETVRDLLAYFPFRYEDWSHVSLIRDLQPGQMATVRVRVELIQNKRSRWRKMSLTEAVVSDESGRMTVGWFYQPYLAHVLKIGDEIYLAGKVDDGNTGGWQMVSPVYEKFSAGNIHTARIVPVYNSTRALSQKQFRFLVKQSLPAVSLLEEWLPGDVVSRAGFLPLHQAVIDVHFPSSLAMADEARRRFKFEELFLFQLLSQILRREMDQAIAPMIPFSEEQTKQFVRALPFQLTDDQRRAAWEILQDMGRKRPMNRLLEGEVGSGKTVVAAVAALNAARAGFQTAYMAPTEILALQHLETLSNLLSPFGISVGIFTSEYQRVTGDAAPAKEKQKAVILKQIEQGMVDVVIGTHALIEDKVRFKNLGLAIIDEQHRFGVRQRKLLREKSGGGVLPHLLSMTATPIPRTLALVFYGDLDLSLIRALPKERKKIITKIVSGKRARQESYQFIRQEVEAGYRAFILCPLIDPSDKLGMRAVNEECEKLQKDVFPDIKIGAMHGRLKPAERERLMREFAAGEMPILVSTTVVEVGVNVPAATVMMIEAAERFGLAQLHQLRGRVGRGAAQGYCFLMADTPTESAKRRLKAFLNCDNGFELAEQDLALRGPGEIWGTSQSGFPEFQIASLDDVDILKMAKEEATRLSDVDPELREHPMVKERFQEFIRLIKTG
ncbi:MAG: ATP-dependent DNA helicase RecG [Patescibacteria group bacterium]